VSFFVNTRRKLKIFFVEHSTLHFIDCEVVFYLNL